MLLCLFCNESYATAKSAYEVYQKDKTKYANKNIAHELIEGEFYFSAIPFINKYLENNNDNDPMLESDIETLVLKTGTIAILNMEDQKIEKFQMPSTSLILGTRLFNKNKLEKAFEVLSKIPEDHRFSIEGNLIRGTIKNLQRKNIEAMSHYESCLRMAEKIEIKSTQEKMKKYYSYLKETCLIRKARLKIEDKKYSEAIEIYNQIDKTSYKWPYIILEKAWANYYLKDYNRTLGLTVTYKSPLLDSYFFPEAEVLTALSYYNLCLWDDALKIVNNYYDFYQPKAIALKDIIAQNKNSETYYLDLYYSDSKTREDLNPFIRNLITQTRKQVKFNIDLSNLKASKDELALIQKLKNKNEFTEILEKNNKSTIEFMSKKINYYIKKEIFSFINEIHRHSYSMFNLKLDLLSRKRDELYGENRIKALRSRGSEEFIQRNSGQYFFDFNGSFWADELGDYSFGLNSQCSKEKSE